jgi:hypothetical protein
VKNDAALTTRHRCGRQFTPRALEQVTDLVIGRLAKIRVPETHGIKRLWCDGTNDIIGLAAQCLARLGWRDRDGNDDLRRVFLPERSDSDAHGRPRREPIIHNDYRPPGDVRRRTVTPVLTLTPFELALFCLSDRIDLSLGDSKLPDDGIVDEANASARNRTHSVFFVSRHAEFPNDKEIEWRVQRSRYLERDWHSTSRESKHEDV